MSILVCTPCYGGQATLPYMKSIMSLQEEFLKAGVKHDFLFTADESLIQRARNTSVATFLKTDYEALFFIDADIEFKAESVASLWNMLSDGVEVAVGAYSMKRPDMPLSAWENGALVNIEDRTEPFEVDYAGTGFMMIKRQVFLDMMDAFPERCHTEGHVGDCFSWFDPRVDDGIYLSEDYAFCKDWRNMGGHIILDPTIKLIHYGTFGYGH